MGGLDTRIRLAGAASARAAAYGALAGDAEALPPPWRVLRLRYPARLLRIRA